VSSDLEGHEAFAAGVITIEERETSQRESLLPEPADGLGAGLSEIVLVDGEGVGELVAGCAILCEQFSERGGG
jgi:hypothetical protein